jgi:hypothetical protein
MLLYNTQSLIFGKISSAIFHNQALGSNIKSSSFISANSTKYSAISFGVG